jgi:hypothetical protein
MKKLISVVALACLLTIACPAFAAKPADNNAGAQTYAWNLSGAVMPVPPYGSLDIPGSDTNSKLIVNQPNGKVLVNMTGVMKGLNPNTDYTVYLSNGYTKYAPLSTPDVQGTYTWLVLGTYAHDLVITTQNSDGTFSGTGGYPAGNPSQYQTTETITGQVTGNQITFTTTYAGPYNPGYFVTVSGTIAPDGSMSGTSPWEWHTTSGHATLASGSTGWPGLLTGMSPFTFTTDNTGFGSWHVNLKTSEITLPKDLSVWINGGGATILISDPVTLK